VGLVDQHSVVALAALQVSQASPVAQPPRQLVQTACHSARGALLDPRRARDRRGVVEVVRGDDQQSPVDEQAANLADDTPALRVAEHVDHVERRHNHVEGAAGERRQIAQVSDREGDARVGTTAVLDHRRREVDAVNLARELTQMACQAAGPAAELEHTAAQLEAVALE